ncbi:phosphoribosyltransferase [Porphyromonas sp.]|uniref:phosphoribosyltransferase n=1 Tax=Porphyromonas sp. TaxID=1924944 RepID=UPI0026DD25D1|nr:phosphoribosyltransferase family protein [Porphyromonas sp.]MDO4695717.1 phosphoribosyltransferase family protein [Porphyromonas sp.]MDO4771103.1 phosphoribosyltransferase family protein [Porphyromonas sp.]
MKRVHIKDRDFELYLKYETLSPEIARVAREIKRDLADKNPLFVCILNGAFTFAAELMIELNDKYELAFAKYSSYKGMESTGNLTEEVAPEVDMNGRTIVIIEDLVDSGFTLHKIKELYFERGAKDIKIAVMLSKPDAPKAVDVLPDYVGMEIPNDFIVGHGLDYDGHGRMYKDIYKVCE